MWIITDEKDSCWTLLYTQNIWTCSKLSYQPAEATWMRRTLFEWIVIVIVIARMTRNDQEWSPEQTQIVNSSSFGSRFGTLRLGHSTCCVDSYLFLLFSYSIRFILVRSCEILGTFIIDAPVLLCRICCRTRTNVNIFLLYRRVK